MKAEKTETKKKQSKKRKDVVAEAEQQDVQAVEVNEAVIVPEQDETIKEQIDLANKILEWKSKYRKVYKTFICGDNYIWKPLKRSEYVAISEMENGDKDLETIRVSLLYPSFDVFLERSEELAGLHIAMMEEILSGSGFKADSFLL